ncbi:hypothetical protein [Streptomyces sp. ISL-11]|uniref:hypothetical protein n=1 Tax=Streptomyces sp. ISL-11 TaxID=2819174 RepID=UPI001BE674B0|nr:hypothetical protein [Streptomyces sp. ISL-11]MBT2385624.1 hypothetical protein [Streptomyces sp. ISL-11]
MTGAATESSDVVHHLLVDSAIKVVIVVVALAVLAVGMTALWRTVGRGGDRSGGADD